CIILQAGVYVGDGYVESRADIVLAGDDQRRARIVVQDRVHLVDDGVVVAALHHLRAVILHVVAQVVEAELVVGGVGDVAGIGRFALVVRHAVDDDAGREAEEAVDAAHPLGVALGEVVVDGNDVDALAGQRVEVGRQGCNQRLTFTGAHLGDAAAVQDHAADQLHVKRPQAKRALRRFAHYGKGRNEKIIDGATLGELGTEL